MFFIFICYFIMWLYFILFFYEYNSTWCMVFVMILVRINSSETSQACATGVICFFLLYSGCNWLFDGEKHYTFSMIFSTTPTFSTAIEDNRSPNTMSLVPCSHGKVKLSSGPNGSAANSGEPQLSVAYCIEIKSNTRT